MHTLDSEKNQEDEMKLARQIARNSLRYGKMVHQQQMRWKTDCKPMEQKLLRFPVMDLNDTLNLFLRTCEPLLTEDEMCKTVHVTEKFRSGEGRKLQELLKDVAKKEENWLAQRWLRSAYLEYRDPVTVFSSPGMAFPLSAPFDCDEDMANYTAKVIFNLLKYKELVDNGKIPVVKMGDNELDNSQFYMVFGTNRTPGLKADCLEFHPNSKHIVVIHKNHFYKLPVYDESCVPLHFNKLTEELMKILDSGPEMGAPIGLLSLDKRDNWGAAFDDLSACPENEQSLKEIKKALFTVSLDSFVSTNECNVYSTLNEQLIHGGGSEVNSANRWMDKTIQLIVNPSGLSGFTYEHSPAEGQPIALITDFVLKNLKDDKFYESGSKNCADGMQKLKLETPEKFDQYYNWAKSTVDELAHDLNTITLFYKQYGKGFLKKQKISPDSFIQMAQQYAFYKLHGEPAAHYESAHLRIYRGGRTETIRSCSVESVKFAKAMCDINESYQKKLNALKKAVNGHRAYTVLALQGKGVDRHLLGLKMMAQENNLPIPEFYQTPGYVKSNYFRLSTSQVASPNPAYMCYGPLVKDGYGCCYNPREEEMIFAISSWRSCPVTNAEQFGQALTDALDHMYEVLCVAGDKPKSKI